MPRPRKYRRVGQRPVAVFFKPQGIPIQHLKGLILPVEGLEALRLADGEGIDQQQASEMMEISRPTFSRILAQARHTVARALSNGWAIRIEGGSYQIEPHQPSPAPGGKHRRRNGGL